MSIENAIYLYRHRTRTWLNPKGKWLIKVFRDRDEAYSLLEKETKKAIGRLSCGKYAVITAEGPGWFSGGNECQKDISIHVTEETVSDDVSEVFVFCSFSVNNNWASTKVFSDYDEAKAYVSDRIRRRKETWEPETYVYYGSHSDFVEVMSSDRKKREYMWIEKSEIR